MKGNINHPDIWYRAYLAALANPEICEQAVKYADNALQDYEGFMAKYNPDETTKVEHLCGQYLILGNSKTQGKLELWTRGPKFYHVIIAANNTPHGIRVGTDTGYAFTLPNLRNVAMSPCDPSWDAFPTDEDDEDSSVDSPEEKE